jgi:uncharacterized protein involved in exopolysaccharide biosynthesis
VAADLERRQIGEQFRILDPARVPIKPFRPNRLMINGVGVGLGLLVGVALVALLELRDSSFRTEVEITNLLTLPVLAMIPVVETPADLTARRRRRAVASVAGFVLVSGAGYVFWAMKLWRFVA